MYRINRILIQIIPIIVILIFLIISTLSIQAFFLPYEDDAFILLRYSRNITSGCGFVWNCGEPVVEGFTSFLFQMLLVFTETLGWNSPSRSGWLGIFLSICTILTSIKLADLLTGKQKFVSLIACIGLIISPIFMKWSISGLDTPLYSFIFILATLSYLNYKRNKLHPIIVGLAFTLLALTRPEGVFVVGFCILYDSYYSIINKRKLLKTLVITFTFLCVFLPYFLWRWNFFGYPFPNTYYAKTGGGFVQIVGGVSYVLNSFEYIFPHILSLIILLVCVIGIYFSNFSKSDYCFVGILILITIGIIILNGGDHFAGARFITPLLPFILILFGSGMINIMSNLKIPKILRYSAIAFTALLGIYWLGNFIRSTSSIIEGYQNRDEYKIPNASPNTLQYFNSWGQSFIIMGKTLKALNQPDLSIACAPIGAIGYYSELHIIDMVGIVDPVIAHEPFDDKYIATWRPGHDKGNGDYVLSKKPDFIQFINRLTSQPLQEPDERALSYKSIVEIWNSSEFHNNYQFYPLRIEGGWYYNLYRRINTPKGPE